MPPLLETVEVETPSNQMKMFKEVKTIVAENEFFREMCFKQESEIQTLKSIVWEQESGVEFYEEKVLNAQLLSEERAHQLKQMMVVQKKEMEDSFKCEVDRMKRDFSQKLEEISSENEACCMKQSGQVVTLMIADERIEKLGTITDVFGNTQQFSSEPIKE
ncbi:hypothetical protein DMENIID0001_122540 [Sergentomyia squamirostris]